VLPSNEEMRARLYPLGERRKPKDTPENAIVNVL
jgi:hypothetical protein